MLDTGKFKQEKKVSIWFTLLFVSCLVVRIFFILIMEPGIENDSPGYITLAHQIASLNLDGDNGFRTPIYPLFIALFNFDPALIRLGQTILGLCILSMLFWTAWHFTQNPAFSFLAGALYGFNLAQIYFESKVLTETLATFLVVAALIIFVRLPEISKSKPFYGWVLGIAILVALASLTRPLFFFLAPVLALIFFLSFTKKDLRQRLRPACLLLLPSVVLIGGWSIFNYFRLGYFGPSTFTGFGLADHAITFIQDAPDQYAKIRDVYLAVLAREGSNTINIWDGFSQLQVTTVDSFVNLSRTLFQMSLYLFVHHPVLYLKSIAITWVKFWNEPGWWTWPSIRSESLQIIVAYAWRIEKYLLVFLNNLPFLLLTAYSTINLISKKPGIQIWHKFHLAALALVVLLTSVVQAIVERGDVPRYAIPVQPLASLLLVIYVWQVWASRKQAQTVLN